MSPLVGAAAGLAAGGTLGTVIGTFRYVLAAGRVSPSQLKRPPIHSVQASPWQNYRGWSQYPVLVLGLVGGVIGAVVAALAG